MQRKSRFQRSPNPRKGGARSSGAAVRPPQFTPTMRAKHKFRFLNSAGSTKTITRANLLNLVVVATTSSASSRIIEGIRLRSVEVWTSPPSLGTAPLSCSVEWVGSNAPSTIQSDTSMGVLPAHVKSRPPPMSSNQWWSMSGTDETDPLFTIIASTESVCDVAVTIRYVDNEAATAGGSPTGASVGQVYYDYLDGSASGTWAPVGVAILP
jgi:hypothetical protein